ncbi:uroporphyrinogen-III synthase [Serinibacter salmoneus]|uniref:Uroporphyrinogen-III synthase n=1 Tax=Serinibacter salmoneus TaxID=556530 RepID=A0A2A9D1G3_9MICO|nr:uroporphyrinogen-III synthase [Serinibacter salmoneus]PFG19690.1 uroporphyrinogen-III synthase/uroporphyrinogen III methyltransferase/synthase [Serinibacter salmoneus]
MTAASAEPVRRPRVLVPHGPWAQRVRERGGEAVEADLLRVEEGETPALRQVIAELTGRAGERPWLVLTSARAVAAVHAVAREVPAPVRVAAVGPATAQAAREVLGREADLVPERHDAVGLLAALARQAPALAVLPLSSLAAATLPNGLRDLGWEVRDVVAYRVTPQPPTPHVAEALATGRIDAVVLTSPSVVTALAATLTTTPTTALAVAIGERTAHAAREAGISLAAVAPTPEAVIDTVFRSTPTGDER